MATSTSSPTNQTGIDLASVLTANFNASNVLGDVRDKSSQFTDTILESVRAKTVGARNLAKAEEVLVEEDALVKQQSELTAQRINTQFGVSIDAPGYLGETYAQGIMAAQRARLEARNNIAQKQGINFLDNPLGFLTAQLTVNSDIEAYNKTIDDESTLSSGLRELESHASAINSLNQAALPTVTRSKIDAMKIQKSYAANREAAESEIAGARYGLDNLQVIANTTLKQAELQGSSLNAQNTQKQLEIAIQNARINAARFEFDKENAAFNRDIKLQKLGKDKISLDLVARGYMAATGKEMPEELRFNTLSFLEKDDPKVRAWYEMGRDSFLVDPAGRSLVISTSPAAALQKIDAGYVSNIASPGMRATLDRLDQYRTEFKNRVVQIELKLDPKDHRAVDLAFNNWLNKKLEVEGSNIRSDSIFKPVSFNTLAKQNPDFAASELWTKVLGPLGASGAKLDEPNFINSSVVAAVKKGTIGLDEAASQLAGANKQALELSTRASNFMAFGIVPPQAYNTKSSFGLGNHSDSLFISRQLNRALNIMQMNEINPFQPTM